MSAECTLEIFCRWSFRSVKSFCMFVIAYSMLLILSSVAFCIASNLSSSLFAMSAIAVMCFTSKASVRVVSWAASSKMIPVGSWTAWAFSFLRVLLFFFAAALAFQFFWSSLLPFTSARGTRRFFPVFETEDFLLALGFGPEMATFSSPASTPSLCCFWIWNNPSMQLLSTLVILLLDPTITVTPAKVFLLVWTKQGLSKTGGHSSTIILKGTTLTQSSSGQYTSA